MIDLGDIEFRFSAIASRWECEFQGRVRALWTFAAKGDDLTGTLYILQDRWVARNVKARKLVVSHPLPLFFFFTAEIRQSE